MAYKSVVLEDSITINRIISVHYFQYMSDFSFPGESHDFWELICVDRGEIDAVAGDRRLTLKKGNILFHKPNEFHNVLTNGKVSPSLVVIGFECHSPAIKSFEDQLMSVQDTEKKLLAQIIGGCFYRDLLSDHGMEQRLERVPARFEVPFGIGFNDFLRPRSSGPRRKEEPDCPW